MWLADKLFGLVQRMFGSHGIVADEGAIGQAKPVGGVFLSAFGFQLGLEVAAHLVLVFHAVGADGAGAGTDQAKFQGIGRRACRGGQLLDAQLEVVDTLGRDGVGAQVGGGVAALVEAVLLLQAPEEGGRAVDIEACLAHDLQANAVGFTLGVPRKGQHGAGGQRRAQRHGADTSFGIIANGQQPHYKASHIQHAGLFPPLQHAGNVMLGDVAHFVAHHAGQLGFTAGGGQQAGMHADVPARQGEGVDAGVADDEEFEGLAACRRRAGEAAAEAVDEVGEFGIVVDAAVGAQFAHDRVAQFAFGSGGEFVTVGRTQIRQAFDLGPGTGGTQNNQQGGGQQGPQVTAPATPGRRPRSLQGQRDVTGWLGRPHREPLWQMRVTGERLGRAAGRHRPTLL